MNQKPTRYVMKTLTGLEETLAGELAALGGEKIRTGSRAVTCEGPPSLMYAANLWCRTAVRVLVVLSEFDAPRERDLYQAVRSVPWQRYLSADHTIAVDAVTSSQVYRNSSYVALKVKDAVVDAMRSRIGRRPSVDVSDAAVRINLHVEETRCTLSLDSSGHSLHARGYRRRHGPAPLRETLAAGMVLLSGWKGDRPLLDPMCGAGTIPIEAALIRRNIAPGLLRPRHGFERWPGFDAALWKKLTSEARDAVKPEEKSGGLAGGIAPIVGTDVSREAVEMARENSSRAGYALGVEFSVADFLDADRMTAALSRFGLDRAAGGVLVMNPPYGERMAEVDVPLLYKEIGDVMKQRFAGWEAWILSANRDALKRVGLRPSGKRTLYNGPQECRFQHYELY